VNVVSAIGGAPAIAALALGTESIPRVDMLVGPGNTYVEAAKRQLFGEVGIESLAGPSELVVLADETPSAELIAWDLRAQAEHGSGALAVLVATDHALLEAVAADLGETEAVTLIEADSLSTALAFVNAYAPEHLQLMVADAAGLLGSVRHAGAIFVGESSGTAYGDYVAGSNHILPTGATARFASGLSPAVFVRTQEIVEIPPAAAAALARPLAALARAEGLEAHARSAEVRAERIAEQDTSLEKGAAT
jgi:histidinol dehydrogenase